jgi:uncharacterized protein (DUF779 family)
VQAWWGGISEKNAAETYQASDRSITSSSGWYDMGAAQFELWAHTQLIIDVVPGRGAGFSLEAPEGLRFLTRSRAFTEAETRVLDGQGPPAAAA